MSGNWSSMLTLTAYGKKCLSCAGHVQSCFMMVTSISMNSSCDANRQCPVCKMMKKAASFSLDPSRPINCSVSGSCDAGDDIG